MKLLSTQDVIQIHRTVIHAHELQGQAPDKSVETVVGRVLNRVRYGQISDIFELAAGYAVCIAVAHAFNDANKRTAFATMDTILALNGVLLEYDSPAEAGDMIVKVVLGEVDERNLADWLRGKSPR